MIRSIIIILVTLLLISENGWSQHICGGVVGNREAFQTRLKQNVKQAKLNYSLKSSQETVYIPVKFHLVADSDGVGRIDYNDVFDELCILNSQFESLGMVFYIKDGFNDFDHTPTYEAPRRAGASARMLQEITKFGTEAVNIFVTQNADTGNTDNGTTLGFYDNNNDYVVIRKNQVGSSGSTLAHELGHLFSLNHPHYGWEDQPWDLEVHGKVVRTQVVNSSQSTGSVRVELVDRSNCEDSGDFICDTPPDYNFGFTWDRACPKFNTVVLDRNSDTIVPMQNNYMSYFLGCEPYAFTQDQVDVVIADYNSNQRSNLRSDYVPTVNIIEEELVLESPANSATTDFFNGIELRWTEVANADSYYLNFSGAGEDLRYIVNETAVYITDLSPNVVYTWSVTPFNETGGCGEKQSAILRTNDLETSTVDPAIDGSIVIQPNPAFISDNLNVYVESEEQVQGQYLMTSINGKVVVNKPLLVSQGKNHIKVNTTDYSPGVYLFSILTSKGVTTKKVILQ